MVGSQAGPVRLLNILVREEGQFIPVALQVPRPLVPFLRAAMGTKQTVRGWGMILSPVLCDPLQLLKV